MSAFRKTASPDQHSLFGMTFPALEQSLVADGLRPIHARAVWRHLYHGSFDPEGTDLPPPLRRWLGNRFLNGAVPLLPLVEKTVICSSDGLTRKFLLQLADGQTIESVLMRYPGRQTACLSTQVGCAMGCVFCATGQLGFSRHLTASEIVAQVAHVRAAAGGELRNLVLMGMGEPLHNYEQVMTALEIISDTRGINIGPRRITISTVGVAPAIQRLADEGRPYHLAVSLHGASDEERAALVPIGRRWPLSELMSACRYFVEQTDRKIFFEWTLIAGRNDGEDTARRLGTLLRGMKAHVNLIPLNPTEGFQGSAAGVAAAHRFQAVLAEAGIPSTIRQRRGIDVAAGCGQLKAAQEEGAGPA